MLRVMTGMHQWGLRRFPQRDARERSREPGRVLAGRGGVVLGMSSQRESAGASQRYLLAEPRIGWSVPETVYVSGRRGVPGAT